MSKAASSVILFGAVQVTVRDDQFTLGQGVVGRLEIETLPMMAGDGISGIVIF
ncbi:hypothetical protein [Arthrobacter livingstonensis]|uniref:hypothetical protein n=1 Tax=Arthrobacter livingstonensis TaxID=670078 RepID=UPI001474149B|nr:hypothetical protein [Arthrobacter livingstonensis]